MEEITNVLPSLEGKEEHKLEYIKQMIDIVNQDKRRIMLFITFIFGTFILILSQLYVQIVGLPQWLKIGFCLSWTCLIISAVLFYRYWRVLHITSMRMVRCIPSLDVYRTRELWAGKLGVYQTYKQYYKMGNRILTLGYFLLFMLFFYILLK